MGSVKPDQSRAINRQEREERVQVCLRLMPHEWERGKTAKRLAEEHGESLAVWEQASSEAWRRHKAQDATWVREHLCGELEKALRTAKRMVDLRDRVQAIVAVARTWAPLAGVVAAPQKLEHSAVADIGAVFKVELSVPERPAKDDAA